MDLRYYLWLLRASREELLYSEFKSQIVLEFILYYGAVTLISLLLCIYYKSLIGIFFFFAIFASFDRFKDFNEELAYKWNILESYKFFKMIYYSYWIFIFLFFITAILYNINSQEGNNIEFVDWWINFLKIFF